MQQRKIIHIDMDAFYASVEILRHPHLRDEPLVVSSHHPRAVIAAASYAARKYGLRSAMPMGQAKKLCPHVVVIEPDFAEYRRVSGIIHEIFQQHTPIIEPLSLDEAYLDVTHNLQQLPSATDVAIQIRQDIWQRTQLTASAGVAPNKFLAKIASDWHKPNGLCVIKPHQVQGFIQSIGLEKIPGVGKVTLSKLKQMNLHTLADLHNIPEAVLVQQLGKYGHQLHLFAQGIDHRPVEHQRQRQQISKEITFHEDLLLNDCTWAWQQLTTQVWQSLTQKQLTAQTVHIKLRQPDFQTTTQQKTFSQAFSRYEDFTLAVEQLRTELKLSADQRFRLIGIGVSHLSEQQHSPQLQLWSDP